MYSTKQPLTFYRELIVILRKSKCQAKSVIVMKGQDLITFVAFKKHVNFLITKIKANVMTRKGNFSKKNITISFYK